MPQATRVAGSRGGWCPDMAPAHSGGVP